MEQVLHGLYWNTLLLYLDNVILISLDFHSYLQRLEKIFKRLQDAWLKLKPTKCELLQDGVHSLDHIGSTSCVATDPANVKAIKEWEPPKDVKSLHEFLETAYYYSQYLPDFANIAKPLT